MVKDPDGYEIGPETQLVSDREVRREIPGVMYYSIDPPDHDVIEVPYLKLGAYEVRLVPKPDTTPESTYSFSFEGQGLRITFAEDAKIEDIPEEGYGLIKSPDGITAFQPVQFDVKPGDVENVVPLRSRGLLATAILSSRTFDPQTIDPELVRFGPAGASEAHGRGHWSDVNGDGLVDLVLHFSIAASGLIMGSSNAAIEGTTTDGRRIRGTDKVTVR